jgi:four helix bundle protein
MAFRSKEFRVYKEAKEYCGYCRSIIKGRLEKNDRGLADQLQRALNSIVLNIVEGSADNSGIEFARFLGISIRSVYENIAGFDLATHYGLIDDDANAELDTKKFG